jgi:2-desacetyl-2-hydroxyethyl bacteriochlorophyllide A dehydrogenase
MKAAVFHGPGDIRVEEIEDPQLKGNDILLKIHACGICGSDLHTYKHGLFEDLGVPIKTGRVLGHEFSGEIAEINGAVPGFKVGDRVVTVANGGNAEYMRIPWTMAPLIFLVSEGISFEEAATTEPLATSLHAVHLANPVEGETHVIVGAGIIGLGVLQVLKALFNVKVIVVDLSDKRLELARALGAYEVINAAKESPLERIKDLTGEEKVSFTPRNSGKADTVYDCAGLSKNYTGTPVLEQAVYMVKNEGKVVIVAVFEKPLEMEYTTVVRKGITLFGSWAWKVPEFSQALELICTGKIDRKPLISNRFPLDQAREAYETQLNADAAVKVMLIP